MQLWKNPRSNVLGSYALLNHSHPLLACHPDPSEASGGICGSLRISHGLTPQIPVATSSVRVRCGTTATLS